MNSLQFFFKNAWRWKCNLPELEQEYANQDGSVPSIEEIKRISFNEDFVRLMNNRMVMGFFRYGNRHKQKVKYANIPSAIKRIHLYEQTGNLECLVDAANMLRMEFEIPQNPKAYFESVDDGLHCEKV